MSFRAVLFDLDGTLLDTLADLAGAMNRVLSAVGLPGHPVEAYRGFVGDGARRLVTRALPAAHRSETQVRACLTAFRVAYHDRWDRETRPYAGIPEVVDTLRARGLPLAVLTNKPQAFAELCVRGFFPGETFRIVQGQREGRALKPDPAGALEVAEALDVAPAGCLLVGDSGVDMETARRAGMIPVGAAWGFRSEAELREAGAQRILQRPQDLLA